MKNEKIERIIRGGREWIEASYLQQKLSKITADEVLDFYLVMTLAPTHDGFIAHCEHDRAVGRASGFISCTVHDPHPTPCKRSRLTSLLFCCSSCKRDFIADYTIRDGVKVEPICPECGSSKFVYEVVEDEQ